MTYRWILRPTESLDAIAAIRRDLNELPLALARSLVLRGVDTFDRARRFFRPALSDLHDPLLMTDMATAADRICHAIHAKEHVLVYGDYDVDGTTATALMVSLVRDLGGTASFFIPDRITHGYGLCRAGIDHAVEQGVSLIITLDCGITAFEEAAYARQKGLDLIICDHHTPRADLPKATAVLNPKRPDCHYPFHELSGCGVGFKLAQAVLQRRGRPREDAYEYLDLVALSTASDVVPVRDENRILLAGGLDAIRSGKRVGLRALAEIAGINVPACTCSNLLFGIGPRINAAGRVGDASLAVELLLADDPDQAHRIAAHLDTLNKERRAIDRETQGEATVLAERHLQAPDRRSIVLHQPEWHLGVIGIVASRLVERFYRPTVLLGAHEGVAKGSARSIAGVNIHSALVECSDLLLEFGGHDGAAGLTLPIEAVPAFQERFDAAVAQMITPELMFPSIEVDSKVELGDITPRFWAVLRQFEPFGPDNVAPVFQADQVRLARPARTVGRGMGHLKFEISSADSSVPMSVIGFGLGNKQAVLEESWREGRPLDLLFSVEENEWNGRRTLQLSARDVRLSS